jgi:hypothetical protein
MEVAIHINISNQCQPEEIKTHLGALYQSNFSFEELPTNISRIYIGDEFCFNRRPTLTSLKKSYLFAEKNGLKITLLTPVLTNEGIEEFAKLFDFINEVDPHAELVINDWGVLAFIRNKYPSFKISLGRLLNKGFKDPRLTDPDKAAAISEGTKQLLNQSTFDLVTYQKKMLEMGVLRLERDIMPYATTIPKSSHMIKTSIYLPFGYITSGRVCWIASFGQQAREKFVPGNICTQPCNDISLNLKDSNVSLKVIQSGNTFFYLYPFTILKDLLLHARDQDLRLVYQGFYMGQTS